MSKKIIILEVVPNDVGDQIVTYAMWFYPPSANNVPKPNAQSSWRQASAQDTADIQAGVVIEEVRTASYNTNMTVPEFKTYLEAVYATRAGQINAAPNPNAYYGQFFDGSTWSF